MSFDYTGSFSGSFSGSFTGEVVAVNGVLSSSAQVAASLPVGVISSSNQVTYDGTGLISSSNQVSYTQVRNKPTTISAFQKNSIVANNRFREVTYPADSSSVSTRLTDLEARESSGSFSSRLTTLESATDNTGSDSQTLSFNDSTNALTISDGNVVDLSALAGGGGGGSGLAITASDEGSELSKNVRTFDFVGNAVTATGAGNAITVTINTGSLPNGLISGSSQVSYSTISDVPNGIVSSSVQTIANLPSGVISGSSQITITTSSITDFNTEVSRSAAQAGFGSGGDSIPDGTISSSAQVISSLPSGVVSGSSQVSYNSISDVPSGILSGSITTSSITNFDTEVSRSAAAAGFGAGGSDQVFSAGVDITINSGSGTIEISGSEFDGNRTVSNTDLPSGIYNTNFGTSGSLSNFIEKVFFPNTVPTIDQGGFTIEEFETSGSSIGTITATDAEGQSVTFRAASSYTDDFFKIASDGEITLNNQSTESMNTDNTPGSGSHPFPIEAVDTFNGVGSRTIYIRVNPNTAPKWRQTSVSGTVITSFTQSLNEDSVAGNNKVRVYVSDDESDTITINTGSLPSDFSDKFSLTIASTYVQLNQTTASLDYEDTTQFDIVLTASDQHYQDGDDTEAIAYLPFQVAVVDNLPPSVNDQTITGVNENSSNGANPGNRNTITFTNFTLVEANLDGGSNITSSLGGNSLYDPHSDPFDCSTAGVVTRKSGVYLNSDVANRYIYRVTVSDAFNTTTDTGLITIPIADDAQSTVSDNWTNPYIIESAVDGDSVRINSNGRTGTIAQWSSAASQRWEVTSENDLIEVTSLTGSSTQLRVKNDISGSLNSFDGDDRISVRLTASEHGFETTKQYIDVDVRVAINNAPDITFTNTSANLNTNGARSGSLLTTIGFSDTEGDTLDHDTFTFTDPSGQLNSVRSGNTYLIQASENLSRTTPTEITTTTKATNRYRTKNADNESLHAQAGIGTLTGDTTSYIIASAVSGAKLQDASGEGNGNDSDLNVSYSPNYNSQVVQSFTSSNSAIAVDNNGGLSLAVDMSTTTSGSGDTITTDITFRDQYDNIGSGSVTVNVFASDTDLYGKVYVYDVGFNNATYNTAVGISSEDSSTPPVATPFSNIGFVDAIRDDNRIGSSSFTYTYGSSRTATLLASGSGDNVHDVLRAMGSSGNITRNTNVHFVILMPSGSSMSGVPTSTRDSYGGSTLHEYVLEVGTDGTTIDGTNTIESSDINQFDLATDHFGYTTWFMVGATNQVTSTSNINLGLNPSSGSGGA